MVEGRRGGRLTLGAGLHLNEGSRVLYWRKGRPVLASGAAEEGRCRRERLSRLGEASIPTAHREREQRRDDVRANPLPRARPEDAQGLGALVPAEGQR
jgi:hypothetical protein